MWKSSTKKRKICRGMEQMAIMLMVGTCMTATVQAAPQKEQHGLGYRQEETTAPVLKQKQGDGLDELLQMNLPSKYKTAVLPPVRDQGEFGTCWAFSTVGLAEINILKTEGRLLDLSELQLAYFTSRAVTDPFNGIGEDYNSLGDGTSDFLNTGGNLIYSMQALAAWKGLGAEEEYPYEQYSEEVYNYEYPYNATYDRFLNTVTDEDAFHDQVHIKNAYRINMKDNAEEVKRMIMELGAVGASYYDSTVYYDREHNSYYNNKTTSTNHAVCLVGWDDNFSADNFLQKPQKNGAWLVRNSWGYEGEDRCGYFWISYCDTSLTGAYAFEYVSDQSDDFYDNNYQYDGSVASSTYYAAVEGISGANVFTAQHDKETLKAVMVGIRGTNVQYQIQIYTDLSKENDPQSGKLQETMRGTTSFEGLYTFELESPIMLTKGQKYSVVVTLRSDEDYSAGLELEGYLNGWMVSSPAIHKGESFMNRNDSWFDMADAGANGNWRIKALTNDVTQHVHQYGDWISDENATCTTDGTKHRVCMVCGAEESKVTDAGTKLGHSWNKGKVTKASNCKNQGVKTYTCSRCSQTKTEKLPLSKEHTYGSWISDENATCTADGTKHRVCKYCGAEESKVTDAGTKLGHSWDKGKVTKASTCKEQGVKTYTCSRCSQTKTEKLPLSKKHGKSIVTKKKEATYAQKGYTGDTYCSICKKLIKKGKSLPKKAVTSTSLTSIKSTTKGSKGKLTITWKTRKDASGYEIQVSDSSRFTKSGTRTIKITGKNIKKKEVSGLAPGKRAYVRIRCSVTWNKKKYYSGWSGAKYVMIKKG